MKTLTKQQIIDLPPTPETDSIIADILGVKPRYMYQIVNEGETCFYDVRTREHEAVEQLKNSPWLPPGTHVKKIRVDEHYSRDIAAAFEALENMSRKYECSNVVGREYPYQRGIYVAGFTGGLLQYDTPDLKMFAFANTPALAICRVIVLAETFGTGKNSQ